MSPQLVILFIALYFGVLLLISWLTSRKADNDSFFTGNHQSPWYVVAFGMIGTSLSGVTFISVPGWVANTQFSYMQMVLGYLVGYFVVAGVLMPLYYRLRLTSIYTYLEQRFGFWSYKTGAFYFILSRTFGAALRLLLVANVLQIAVFDALGVPFSVSVVVTVVLIWLYTFRGGIKTIIWTDTLQTFFMLLAVGTTIWLIADEMKLGIGGLVDTISESRYSRIFFFEDWGDKKFFVKQFLAGAFISMTMTGLDQDMMQKNLSCRNLGEAKKNMHWFSMVLVVVNLVFLAFGALLYLFAESKGVTASGDELYPILATQGHLSLTVGVLFILGLIAAAYSSADSALTALTTSFCVDLLGIEKQEATQQVRTRKRVHIGFSLVLIVVILVFKAFNDDSIIYQVLTIAGYTYGPLLGLYAFGLFTKRKPKDTLVPWVAVTGPVFMFWLTHTYWKGVGSEVIIYNGALCFLLLLAISQKSELRKT